MTQGKVLIDLFRLICVLGKWPKNRLSGNLVGSGQVLINAHLVANRSASNQNSFTEA